MRTGKRFKIEYNRVSRGNWRAIFHIDQQGFTFIQDRPKKEVEWFAKCLKIAFKKLEFNGQQDKD